MSALLAKVKLILCKMETGGYVCFVASNKGNSKYLVIPIMYIYE